MKPYTRISGNLQRQKLSSVKLYFCRPSTPEEIKCDEILIKRDKILTRVSSVYGIHTLAYTDRVSSRIRQKIDWFHIPQYSHFITRVLAEVFTILLLYFACSYFSTLEGSDEVFLTTKILIYSTTKVRKNSETNDPKRYNQPEPNK